MSRLHHGVTRFNSSGYGFIVKHIQLQLRPVISLLLLTILQLNYVEPGNCFHLQFNQRDFYDASNISLQYSSGVPKHSTFISLLPVPDPSWHTDPDNISATNYWSGWMSYKNPIPFLDSWNKALSFNTSFTFNLTTPGQYNQCPSGMAFVILSTPGSPSNSTNNYFGLSNETTVLSNITNPFFAIEFDTYKSANTDDPSGSHIGIDISAIRSVVVTDTSNSSSNPYYPELYLYNNYTFKVWVSYEASLNLTKVWMTNRSDDYSAYLNPPNDSELRPILQLESDLSSVFSPKNNMYIGFSAATKSDTSMLGASIYSWYFSIGESNTKSGIRLEIIISVTVVTILAIVSAVSLALYCQSRHRYLSPIKGAGNDTFSSVAALPRYSYKEIQSSTNNFDNNTSLVGEGGFSWIYKGKLADGSIVAIKRLKDGVRKEAEFYAELKMINMIRHRNLLQLQGWCYEKGETLLVYKFMSNGSLDGFIFGEKRGSLDGDTRFRILLGVSAALEYLHFGLGDCVLHRDVKAANVLLTDDFEAVLGDFGLARLIKHNQTVTATMVGTVGYIAPEVVLEGKVTDKADVYSFGVLALEVACGRKVINRNQEPDLRQSVYLVEHVSQLQRKDCLIEALDPSILHLELLKPKSDISEMLQKWLRTLQLALKCCHQNPESRPDMRYVNQEIHNIVMQSCAGVSFQPHVEIGEIGEEYPFLSYNISQSQSSSTDPYSRTNA